MRVLTITPPAPFVSLGEAKQHLRVLNDDEDAVIEAMCAAACGHIDGPQGWIGRAISEQVLEARLPAFGPCGSIALPYPPAIEISSINYIDASGTLVPLDPSAYELAGNMLRPAWPGSFPSAQWRGGEGETVQIRWSCGYADVPMPIKAAALLMVGDLYANRETAALGVSAQAIPMSVTVENLLAPFRVFI